MKKIFISATYKDQRDLIEEVKSKLSELEVEPSHFKEGEFFNGRIDIHSHDRCIELVEEIPNYILIVSYKAGSLYDGTNENYRGLRITHAEFKAAHSATVEDNKRRIYPFVRKEVWNYFVQWKELLQENKEPESWEIDQNLVPLLYDVSKLPWTDTFDTSRDLKVIISKKIEYFVDN